MSACIHEHLDPVQAMGDPGPRYYLCPCGAQVAACAECRAPLNENFGRGIGTGLPYVEHVHSHPIETSPLFDPRQR